MITYDLAKKLKDAGFPQEGMGINSEDCYLPTLSELIEACGDGLQLIYRLGKEEWKAYSNDPEHSSEYKTGEGSTPEEAVARLYLELNRQE